MTTANKELQRVTLKQNNLEAFVLLTLDANGYHLYTHSEDTVISVISQAVNEILQEVAHPFKISYKAPL